VGGSEKKTGDGECKWMWRMRIQKERTTGLHGRLHDFQADDYSKREPSRSVNRKEGELVNGEERIGGVLEGAPNDIALVEKRGGQIAWGAVLSGFQSKQGIKKKRGNAEQRPYLDRGKVPRRQCVGLRVKS